MSVIRMTGKRAAQVRCGAVHGATPAGCERPYSATDVHRNIISGGAGLALSVHFKKPRPFGSLATGFAKDLHDRIFAV
ncbi:hypothetical protein LMG28727_06278 [Paraburkholderia kirstenboschensis]|nr:hypothetical protein LMG28727_06278 [Paraburkholderia kirstenboschensis]